jgi:hypothetical protein
MEEIKTDKINTPVVKPLERPLNKKFYLVLIIPVLLGLITGFVLYKKSTEGKVLLSGQNVEVVSTPTEEGVKDASTFKDTATGTISENDGKLTSEGTHILVRTGGVSQNVYLTSSVIDLSKYVGKNVQVWGETFQGQKAGWLMDVGRIKVQ